MYCSEGGRVGCDPLRDECREVDLAIDVDATGGGDIGPDSSSNDLAAPSVRPDMELLRLRCRATAVLGSMPSAPRDAASDCRRARSWASRPLMTSASLAPTGGGLNADDGDGKSGLSGSSPSDRLCSDSEVGRWEEPDDASAERAGAASAVVAGGSARASDDADPSAALLGSAASLSVAVSASVHARQLQSAQTSDKDSALTLRSRAAGHQKAMQWIEASQRSRRSADLSTHSEWTCRRVAAGGTRWRFVLSNALPADGRTLAQRRSSAARSRWRELLTACDLSSELTKPCRNPLRGPTVVRAADHSSPAHFAISDCSSSACAPAASRLREQLRITCLAPDPSSRPIRLVPRNDGRPQARQARPPCRLGRR